MGLKKLSIITPFFNTPIPLFQKYFEGLSNQSYSNLEILLINDCSTDENVVNFAKEWCIKDHRFKIINMPENSRTYLARCEGLKNFTGDYVTFIDSDDYPTKDYYKCLINTLETNNLDIAVGSTRVWYPEEKKLLPVEPIFLHKYTNEDLSYNKYFINIIDVLYKAEVIKKALPLVLKVNRKTYYCDDTYMGYLISQSATSIGNNPEISDKEFRYYIKTFETISSPQIMDYSKMKRFIDDAYVTIKEVKEFGLNYKLFIYGLEEKIASPYFSKYLSDNEKKELSNYAKSKVSEFNSDIKIPRLIHYIWLSGELLPENIQNWVNRNNVINFLNNGGWEIKIWSSNDLPKEIKDNKWFNQSYKVKNWAACSDYLRLWFIYNYGGFYFDSDVEAIRPLPRNWHFDKNLIFGLQYDGYLECGVFGASPKNKYIKKLLDWYENRDFDPDWMILGKSNNLPEPLNHAKLPIYTAPNLWSTLLFNEISNKEIELLPPDILSACNYTTKEVMATENTVTIHHFAGGWLPKKEYKLNDFGFN